MTKIQFLHEIKAIAGTKKFLLETNLISRKDRIGKLTELFIRIDLLTTELLPYLPEKEKVKKK